MSLLRRFGLIGFRQISLISKSSSLAGESLAVPSPDNDVVYSTKIEKLVAEISHLTLLEVSELSTALKQRLNLPDVPVMPLGGMVSAKVEEDDEAQSVKAVKTVFTVRLMKFDEKQKVALIKECKNLLEGMNLVQAKKFVESCPTIVKADVDQAEAEKLKEALSKVGAEIVID